jgi:hypothetical protein
MSVDKSSTPGCVAPYLEDFNLKVPAKYRILPRSKVRHATLENILTDLSGSTLAGACSIFINTKSTPYYT